MKKDMNDQPTTQPCGGRWAGTFHRVCSRICKSLSVHAVRFQETGGGKRPCGDAQPSYQATAANENTMF